MVAMVKPMVLLGKGGEVVEMKLGKWRVEERKQA